MDVLEIIHFYEDLPGIDVSKLSPGTKIKVVTQNSVYQLEVVNKDQLIAEGGKYLVEPQIIDFNGSTYGGSMIRLGWIGKGMCMEFVINDKMIVTTPVQKLTILGDTYSN